MTKKDRTGERQKQLDIIQYSFNSLMMEDVLS